MTASRPSALLCALFLLACRADPGGPAGGAGRVAWRVPDAGWSLSPAMDAATVYFGSRGHEVVALERASGRLRWRARTDIISSYPQGRTILVAGDVVVMNDFYLYAFDRATGARAWTFRPANGDQPGITTMDTDGVATVFAPSYYDHRVYAVNARDGTERWMTELEGDSLTITFSPRYAAGRVFVGLKRFGFPTSGAFAALDAADGRLLWRHDFVPSYPGALYGSLGGAVYREGTVFVAVEDGQVYAFDASTGAVRWIAPRVHTIPPAVGGTYGDHRALAIAGDVIVAASNTGILVGLDAATGSERWRQASVTSSSVNDIAGGRTVFATSAGGELFALDPTTGRERWRFGSSGPARDEDVLASPGLPAEGIVYVAGFDAYYALRDP